MRKGFGIFFASGTRFASSSQALVPQEDCKTMNQQEIKRLAPEKRKKAILKSLSELTQKRDHLEEEIRQLCRLWDETITEIDGKKASQRLPLSGTESSTLSRN